VMIATLSFKRMDYPFGFSVLSSQRLGDTKNREIVQ
jgi:hypothetical protein